VSKCKTEGCGGRTNLYTHICDICHERAKSDASEKLRGDLAACKAPIHEGWDRKELSSIQESTHGIESQEDY
jgi:hypothetical protein